MLVSPWLYLVPARETVLPVAADRLAASSISVTITFVSREDCPSGFKPPKSTARRYETESSFVFSNGFASADISSFSGERPIPRSLQNRLRVGISQNDRRFVIHSRIHIRLDLLRHRGHRVRSAAIHQPGHQVRAIAPKIKERAPAV